MRLLKSRKDGDERGDRIMPLTLALICAVLGLVCLVGAAFGVASRINLQAAGLALWLLSAILRGFA